MANEGEGEVGVEYLPIRRDEREEQHPERDQHHPVRGRHDRAHRPLLEAGGQEDLAQQGHGASPGVIRAAQGLAGPELGDHAHDRADEEAHRYDGQHG